MGIMLALVSRRPWFVELRAESEVRTGQSVDDAERGVRPAHDTSRDAALRQGAPSCLRGGRLGPEVVGAGEAVLRPVDHPHALLGFRKDGWPIHPILGADERDPSNDPSPQGGTTVDQDTLSWLLAREKQQGERTGIKQLLEGLGFARTEDLTQFVTAQHDAQTAESGQGPTAREGPCTRRRAPCPRGAQGRAAGSRGFHRARELREPPGERLA